MKNLLLRERRGRGRRECACTRWADSGDGGREREREGEIGAQRARQRDERMTARGEPDQPRKIIHESLCARTYKFRGPTEPRCSVTPHVGNTREPAIERATRCTHETPIFFDDCCHSRASNREPSMTSRTTTNGNFNEPSKNGRDTLTKCENNRTSNRD